jgi:hypothetical protein
VEKALPGPERLRWRREVDVARAQEVVALQADIAQLPVAKPKQLAPDVVAADRAGDRVAQAPEKAPRGWTRRGAAAHWSGRARQGDDAGHG